MEQKLKIQLGELILQCIALTEKVEQLTKENDDLKKQLGPETGPGPTYATGATTSTS
jgi:hypothetical protein